MEATTRGRVNGARKTQEVIVVVDISPAAAPAKFFVGVEDVKVSPSRTGFTWRITNFYILLLLLGNLFPSSPENTRNRFDGYTPIYRLLLYIYSTMCVQMGATM